MATVFTIDPGISGTGIAIWDYPFFQAWEKNKRKMGNWNRLDCLGACPIEIKQQHGLSMFEHLNRLSNLINKYDCRRILCEDVEYYHSVKGDMVLESGDVFTLAKFIGGIMQLANSKSIPIELAFAKKWKGQWKKRDVVAHIKKIWPDSVNHCKNEKTAHTWEAAGIGFWKIGLL